jgi:hypothetical protein
MSRAMEWVSRIFAMCVAMVGPGLLGMWLDGKLGTVFLGMLGFGLGVALGIYYLLVITKQPPGSRPKKGPATPSE